MTAWKQPDEKAWYQIIVDGKLLGILEEKASTEKEINRLQGLAGIEITPAKPEVLMRFNARTILPKRIWGKMEFLYKQLVDYGGGSNALGAK